MPGGEYSVPELDEAGGISAVMKQVEQYLHVDAMTTNGNTVGINLENIEVFDSDVIKSPDDPVFERGLVIMKGNLATSAVARFSVFPPGLRRYSGPARVFDSQEEAREGISAQRVGKGDAVIVRYEGPRGGPGMPDLLPLMYALHGAGLADSCPLITDGKLSGFARGPFICQTTPEAAVGGPRALVQDNDIMDIDVTNGRLDIKVPDEELRKRKQRWVAKEPKVKRGYLTLWAKMADSAARGGGLVCRI
jgi:dihydroxy-acid dehydratase